ncbi:DNA-binding transcriptional ArsR family regulator [Bradyrhizobium japonicum]|uniref:helix-turn-helix domain-containing protein n=2 Tax=Nitrobacteraceae TaxID=41294 RepID=UPI0012FDAA8B|nr:MULTISPECIES: helix-turn-helix domain-containing protein [Bradyrhizobium]MBR0941806.1 helix-turn-helix transcriptional regulator [Bradyrhizobium liaoningense]
MQSARNIVTGSRAQNSYLPAVQASETPIPLRLSNARRALAEMFIDLCLAFHATTVPLDQEPGETDANRALVAVAAMLGHAEGRPMNASEIAVRLRMPRTSVMRRLKVLRKQGLLQRIKGRYYLEPHRADQVPHQDKFTLILAKGFKEIAPILSEMDT